MLELMGLKAYQEAFMTERINGEMLLECDDEVLQNELKVKGILISFCKSVISWNARRYMYVYLQKT